MSSHRLTILTPEEVEDLYGLPRFSDDDRRLYFDLSPPERVAVDARTVSVAAYLALDLGYFEAKRQFFVFQQEAVVDDLRYVLATLDQQREVDAAALATKLKISEASAIHLAARLASKGNVNLSIRAASAGSGEAA